MKAIVIEVAEWLQRIGLDRYTTAFVDNGFDTLEFLSLIGKSLCKSPKVLRTLRVINVVLFVSGDDQLMALGVQTDHRIAILRALDKVREKRNFSRIETYLIVLCSGSSDAMSRASSQLAPSNIAMQRVRPQLPARADRDGRGGTAEPSRRQTSGQPPPAHTHVRTHRRWSAPRHHNGARDGVSNTGAARGSHMDRAPAATARLHDADGVREPHEEQVLRIHQAGAHERLPASRLRSMVPTIATITSTAAPEGGP